MLYQILIFISSFFDRYLSITDPNLINSSLIYIEFYSIKNYNNKTSDGNCCSASQISQNSTCRACKNYLAINKIFNNETEESYEILNENISKPESVSLRKLFLKVPKDRILSVIHSESSTKKTIDYFWEIDMTVVGKFQMIDVWGHHRNSRIQLFYEVYESNPFNPYRSLSFIINKITYIHYKYQNGKCCHDFDNSECKPCKHRIYVLYNNKKIMEIKVAIRNRNPIVNNLFSLKTRTSFDPSGKLQIIFVQQITKRLIDHLTLAEININPNQRYRRVLLIGNFGHVLVNLTLRLVCLGYTGDNCQYLCPSRVEQVSCKYNTGTEFCQNGALNPPDCDEITNDPCHASPCENGGKCLKLANNFICKCNPRYMGRYCQNQNPNHEICINGVMKENECTCTSNYIGKHCDRKRCEKRSSINCPTHSICIEFWDEKINCICPGNELLPREHLKACLDTCGEVKCVGDYSNGFKLYKCICTRSNDTLHQKCKQHTNYNGFVSLIMFTILTFYLCKFVIAIIIIRFNDNWSNDSILKIIAPFDNLKTQTEQINSQIYHEVNNPISDEHHECFPKSI